jgi:hypothetical protein
MYVKQSKTYAKFTILGGSEHIDMCHNKIINKTDFVFAINFFHFPSSPQTV